ncbi:MAG TPA: hypothetical protein VII76_11650 [Acidimicrobiales bacterium]
MTGAELDDERSFLLDSLEDLERERAAGDLSEADYLVLRDRYTRRAAEVLRALDRTAGAGPERRLDARASPDDVGSSASASSTATPVRRRRTLLVVGLLIVVVAVALTLVLSDTGTRLPGQTETGSVSLSRAAQVRRTLAQAETLESTGNAAQALRLYQQVLVENPNQPDALAQSGWLEFEAGVKSQDAAVLSRAQNQELAAARVEPGAYAPHLYLGSMDLAEANAAGAVTQYRQFLADGPPTAEVQVARPFIEQAFQSQHLAVPAMPGTTPGPTTDPTPPPAG